MSMFKKVLQKKTSTAESIEEKTIEIHRPSSARSKSHDSIALPSKSQHKQQRQHSLRAMIEPSELSLSSAAPSPQNHLPSQKKMNSTPTNNSSWSTHAHSSTPTSPNAQSTSVLSTSAPEEAVADPGLTVDLDLSEAAVGLKGREMAMQVLQDALTDHLTNCHGSNHLLTEMPVPLNEWTCVSPSNASADSEEPVAAGQVDEGAAVAAPPDDAQNSEGRGVSSRRPLSDSFMIRRNEPVNQRSIDARTRMNPSMTSSSASSTNTPHSTNSNSNSVPRSQIEQDFHMTAILMSGASGTGKTALIRNFAASQQHQILYGSGKFDQLDNTRYKQDGPYGVLITALNQVVDQLLKEEEEQEAESRDSGTNHDASTEAASSTNRPPAHGMPAIEWEKLLTENQRSVIQELIPKAEALWSKGLHGKKYYFNKYSSNNNTNATKSSSSKKRSDRIEEGDNENSENEEEVEKEGLEGDMGEAVADWDSALAFMGNAGQDVELEADLVRTPVPEMEYFDEDDEEDMLQPDDDESDGSEEDEFASDFNSTVEERGSVVATVSSHKSSNSLLRESASAKRMPHMDLLVEYKESLSTGGEGNSDFYNHLPQDYHFAFNVSRLTLALKAFLNALASTDRPLVLFLDDIQWADNQALASTSTLFMEFSNNEALSDVDSIRSSMSTIRSSGASHFNHKSSMASSHSGLDSAVEPEGTGNKRKNLLFIGAFRSETKDSTGSEDDLVAPDSVDHINSAKRMEWLSNHLSSKATIRIHLENLDYDYTHQIINAALKQDSERTQTLANVVFRKTNGNPYFVLRYLEMLHRERLLYYSFSNYQWHWNLDLIQTETNVTDNVVNLLSRQVEQLPEEIQSVLRLAACLGFYFDIVVLREIVLREGIINENSLSQKERTKNLRDSGASTGSTDSARSLRSRNGMNSSRYLNVTSIGSRYSNLVWQTEDEEKDESAAEWLLSLLRRAEEEGLIERASNKQYKFSHDRVQRCLYEATPPGRPRDLLHLRIGRLVRDTYLANLDDNDDLTIPSPGQNAMLYFAVEQLNMSATYIKDDEERISLIELNLEASDKAGEHLTFLAAARFLRKAVSLVRSEDWKTRYELCLEVYSAVAEVEHSCGNSDGALKAVDVIIENARTFDDKIRAMFIKVNDLGVQGRLSEAIKEGCIALEHLGEALPAKLGTFNAIRDIYKTNKALRKMTRNQLLNLPEMTDRSKLAASKLLNSLAIFAWHAAEESLLTVIFLRLMTLTLRYGQNQWTPFTFAAFAMLLAAHGDASMASEFGGLSLDLLQRSRSLAALPRTHLLIYTFINHIRQPLLHGVEPLLNAHRIGLESGELEYGSLAVSSYASLYVIFGLPLYNFSSDMRTITEQLHHFHQNVALAALLPWWQFGMNMMGECEDNVVLTGEAMEEVDFESVVQGKAAERTLHLIRLMLYYHFDELDKAMEMYEKLRSGQKELLTATHYINHFQHCYCGLLNLRLARKTNKQKYRRNAKFHLAELDKLVKIGAVNCQPMLAILTAEERALNKKSKTAKALFDSAISRLARSGFVHLQAVTNERAGAFMVSSATSTFYKISGDDLTFVLCRSLRFAVRSSNWAITFGPETTTRRPFEIMLNGEPTPKCRTYLKSATILDWAILLSSRPIHLSTLCRLKGGRGSRLHLCV